MSREKPKELYIAKVTKFGNGAKIKAYKKQIGKEVIVMTKEKLDEYKKKVKTELDLSKSDEKKVVDFWVENEM